LPARLLLLLLHFSTWWLSRSFSAGSPYLRLLHPVVREEVPERIRQQHAPVIARHQVLGQRKEGLEGHAALHQRPASSRMCFSVQSTRASSGVGSFRTSNWIPYFFSSAESVFSSAPETS